MKTTSYKHHFLVLAVARCVAVCGLSSLSSGTELSVGTPVEIIAETRTMVWIEFATQVGKYYQVQFSTDLSSWDNEGYSVKGTGGRIFLQVSSRGLPRAFFRVADNGNPLNLAPSASNGVMPGGLLPFAGGIAPGGWLLCDGSVIESANYPDLYYAIGEKWGDGGDGPGGKFRLPDLRGRTPVGAGQGFNLTNRLLASFGGEEAHVLTIGEMPPHGHEIRYSTANGTNTTGPYVAGSVYAASAYRGLRSDTYNVTVPGDGAVTGGGQAHNTMPPFAIVNYLIKF